MTPRKHDLISGIRGALANFFLETSLNAYLLSNTLKKQGVNEATILNVTHDLQQTLKAQRSRLSEQNFTDVFNRHGIGQFAKIAYQEAQKDPLVMHYGSIPPH